MKKYKSLILILVLGLGLFQSCKKNDNLSNQIKENLVDFDSSLYERDSYLSKDPKNIMRNALLETLEILKNMNKESQKEVFLLINNEVNKKSKVCLNDLLELNPILYNKYKIPNSLKGSFKTDFFKKFNKVNFPNLYYLLNDRKLLKQSADFFDKANIYIYQPYDENDHGVPFSSEDTITYVPAVIDGERGYGYVEDESGNWEQIIVDDDYVANNNTLIIQPDLPNEGGYDSGSSNDANNNIYEGLCSNLEGVNPVFARQVFLGHVNIQKQYDALISFTGNGGGSEFVVLRIDSKPYLESVNDGREVLITHPTGRITFDVARKKIRQMRKGSLDAIWIGALWDPNWECSDPIHEQLFMVYEDDNTADIDFDFSGIKWKNNTYGAVKFHYKVRTKDEIITQTKRDSNEFFASNLLDQGCGCKNGEYSFSDRCWSWYDCGANFSYTMPHRWVPLN